jgi:DNA-binding MarR family transcriptional regulator/ribosomal protein S18 acetylase RimI-like enzyme
MEHPSDVLADRAHLFLGSRLRRLGEQMQADAILLAHEAGLPVQPGQYPILMALQDRGPMAIGELARALGASQPAITKQVSRMTREGVVEAKPAEDRRLRVVVLTKAGEAVVAESQARIWPAMEAAVREVIADLEGPLLDQLATLEQRLRRRPLSRRARPPPGDDGLTVAGPADLAAIASLMNRAYRGQGADAGWTTDAAFIDGERTSEAELAAEMAASPAGEWLVRFRGDALEACVRVEPRGDGRYYLSALTIDPAAQNSGLGRRLLASAEAWIRRAGGGAVELTVLSPRHELVAWYERRGYALTGETEHFPYGDPRFGHPKRDDLHFVVLRKTLA